MRHQDPHERPRQSSLTMVSNVHRSIHRQHEVVSGRIAKQDGASVLANAWAKTAQPISSWRVLPELMQVSLILDRSNIKILFHASVLPTDSYLTKIAMENIARYSSWADEQVLSNQALCAELPSEIVEVIRAADDARYLDTLATAILIPNLSDQLFILYEPLIADLAARWCNQTSAEDKRSSVGVLACFAKILPAKTCLKILLKDFIEKCQGGFIGRLADSSQLQLLDLDDDLLPSFLVALFRLYSHDIATYSGLVSPVQLSSLLRHKDPSIRYLSVRCLALYMKLADAMVEKMILTHVPEEGTIIHVDGSQTTARLFSLWEEKRWRNVEEGLVKAQLDHTHNPVTRTRFIEPEMLSSQTAALAGVLLPRATGTPAASSLVNLPTTTRNLEKLANAMLNSSGILLTGASGSGKTLLVTEAAKLLNKLSSMITLHLNEQTDAKNLLGIYTTSPTDGSFIWQPGVLTRAMLEGSWVLIEDIHRAPREVVGVVLPVIEHGEILISSRNERVRAATGFCVLATTTENTWKKNGVTGRLKSTLNPRLWKNVEVEELQSSELESLLSTLCPILQPRISSFLSVHRQVQQLFEQTKFRSSRVRPPDLRDLLKWCRRSQSRLKAAGLETGAEPVDEGVLEDIFRDAVTCYADHIPRHELHVAVATCIAGEMQVPIQQMRHCLYDRLPTLKEEGRRIRVGRATYPIINSQVNGMMGSSNQTKSAFALTRGTLKTIEEIATAVQYAEPTLLVGETGVGKTTVIQHVATLVGQRLSVFNLSQQSEGGDLLGGFKPITTRSLAIPMSETFDLLFDHTFSLRKNIDFQASTRKCVLRGNWIRLISLWQDAVDMADTALRPSTISLDDLQNDQPNKRRRLQSPKYEALRQRWRDFGVKLSHLKAQVSRGDKKFTMSFVEGKIVQALRNGEWVLLDEINLATPETLESIAELLYSHDERVPSLLLPESGKMERIEGHRNFRIFAAMNPATDTGKRELPPGLRSRFTELFIKPSDTNAEDLTVLISTYLGPLLNSDEKAAFDLAKCYLDVQRMNSEKRLTDGAGQRPHYSKRSFVRSLIYANRNASIYGLRRSLYGGFLMSFATMLSVSSEELVVRVVERHLLGSVKNARSLLNQNLRTGVSTQSSVVFRHHIVQKGSLTPEAQPQYIITPFVERNLLNLARAVSVRRFPILLQGPTSSGKTSMVEYLAKISGNEFIRINNHEHTDLQEYLGSYASGEDGRLQYREGVLVNALRRGQWIVLDELNLAPTDVLEALNRLLDDNRELLIPETQEIVKPHTNFVLFATQNPAGVYGGRKHLSRAFRNRFLELHFDDIPEDELEFILKERTQIAPSFCTRIVAVYKRLSMMRQSSRLFEQRNSFATLRDLFRWAARQADDREQLAVNGYMLLAERVRDPNERDAVKQIIEEVMKVQIDESKIYSSRCAYGPTEIAFNVIWTPAMRRLFVLVMAALKNNEPVLLVGETGCGKTQICQTVAEISGQRLHMLNAQSNLETGDLIGAQRPVRNKVEGEQKLREALQSYLSSQMNGATSLATLEELINQFEGVNLAGKSNSVTRDIQASIAHTRSLFEWADGSLVVAMKRGEAFLLDEISLAEDSVLERLNSVLEPSRSILLAEKGPDNSLVRASPGFQFLATMNPGGDYGKRELSSALRNRLTEIWVPPLSEQIDILPILQSKLGPALPNIPNVMIEFAQWFRHSFHTLDTASVSLRELLTWVDFVSLTSDRDTHFSILHGAALVFIDSIGANPASLTLIKTADIERAQQACLRKLAELLHQDVSHIYFATPKFEIHDDSVQCGSFIVPLGAYHKSPPGIVFDASTTRKNALRVIRALQLPRAILLEGDPGVGKTALVEAIAQAARRRLTRINLSDQTDLMDLFGSDIPVEGGSAGNFSWRDGPFLRAMQNGDWVLLDEMNLATQSVLEGLNSCLDHRKQVYIAELDRIFVRHPDFVFFATQNPHHQGGGRKGLPASFVNRFTVVYADALTEEDLILICRTKYAEVKPAVLTHVVSAVSRCRKLLQSDRSFRSIGGPWEVNLRDISRWLSLYKRYGGNVTPADFHDLIVAQRFRTNDQRDATRNAYLGDLIDNYNISMFSNLSSSFYQVGIAFLGRDPDYQPVDSHDAEFPQHLLPYAKSLIHCVNENWPAVLVGKSGSGKSSLIRRLAALHGAKLLEFSVTEDMDTTDLIGGYEQLHQDRAASRKVTALREECLVMLRYELCSKHPGQNLDRFLELYRLCNSEKLDLEMLQDALMPLARINNTYSFGELIPRRLEVQDARFGWSDGVLVEAVSKGYWLVLDNANTCNSAVLDRVNSLLEPGGLLIVSEQHETDGRPRVVQPHHNFRIFLTVDPRHGELSRAMRNRAVEIYVDSSELKWPTSMSPAYPAEAAVFHWRRLQTIPLSQYRAPLQLALTTVCVGHMSPRDLWTASSQQYKSLSAHGNDQTAHVLAHYNSLPDSLFECIQEFYVEVAEFWPTLQRTMDDQPLHTESNEPLLKMTGDVGLLDKAARYGWLLESFLALCRVRELLCDAEIRAASIPVADMTMLERSIAAQRFPRLSADTARPIGGLVNALMSAADEALTSLMINSLDHNHWPTNKVNAILTLLKDVVDVSKVPRMRSGLLPIYVQIVQETFSKTASAYPATADQLELSLTTFETHTKLRYGQSLSQLWSSWRPRCAANSYQLNALLKLDAIMEAFDKFNQKVALVGEMANVQMKLMATREAILQGSDDVAALLEELQTIISSMDTRTPAEEVGRNPYFTPDFEVLCQYQDVQLHEVRYLLHGRTEPSSSACAAILAGRDTKDPVVRTETNQSPALLSRIVSFAGWSNSTAKLAAWKGKFGQGLLKRLDSCRKEPLKSLDSLTKELSWLSKSISDSTELFCEDLVDLLGQHLVTLIHSVVLCHQGLLKYELRSPTSAHQEFSSSFAAALVDLGDQDIFHEQVPDDHHFRHTWINYLHPALSLASSRVGYNSDRKIGAGLVYFALASLQLWVPDKPTDPALALSVGRDRHQRQKDELETKLEALKIFESAFSGQSSSLRIRRVEQEMDLIGLEPPPPPVVRSQDVSLMNLQAEFSTVLNGIIAKGPETVLLSCVEGPFEDGTIYAPERSEAIDLLKRNINQMVQRLSRCPREYDDLTIPAVQLLQILDLGATMIEWSERETRPMEQHQSISCIAELTPFLGATPASLSGIFKGIMGGSAMPKAEVLYLETASLMATLSPWMLSDLATQSQIMSVFESCYARWKAHLEVDQSKEAKKAKYYEYRGQDTTDDDVDMEEFNDFFPTIDAGRSSDQTAAQMQSYDSKAFTLKIASLHARIFTPELGNHQLKHHLLQRLSAMALLLSGNDTDDSLISPVKMVPALFLLLEQYMHFFQETETPKEYNIYADANVSEARKLLDLVHRIVSRIQAIKEAWSEHALPLHILACCNDVLTSHISDPIAKLLAKTEKLHSILNEWQVVASRQYSVATFIDELTTLIISWRRLELSSWSRLLEGETSKCEEDAKSWWFVVYEVAISIPLRLLGEGDNCASHAEEFVTTLIGFLRTTSLGQFSCRLEVLENFQKMLQSLIGTGKCLRAVESALSNVIDHFRRYEPSVRRRLTDHKEKLEREVREQIKLASWKDTNVTTLRESARRSHFKLFKVVKKYRALLAQPIEHFSAEDANRDRTGPSPITLFDDVPNTQTASEALRVVEQHVSGWGIAPRRLREPRGAATSMIQLYGLSQSDFNIGLELHEYVSNLTSTMAELRSQTPSKVDEDNRPLVLHLKARKRRLLADVLKDVRHMGIRRNLNMQELEKQRSLDSILSSVLALNESANIDRCLSMATPYFHGLLDLIDRARKSQKEHSEDLSSSEVGRCAGSLEGFLLLTQSQRDALGGCLSDLLQLRRVHKKINNLQWLGASGCVTLRGSLKSKQEQVRFAVSWLPQILDVACNVLDVQAKLGDRHFAAVIEGLHVYQAKFSAGKDEMTTFFEQELPSSLQSQYGLAKIESLQGLMVALHNDLEAWNLSEPGAAFLLTQLVPWTNWNSVHVNNVAAEKRNSTHFEGFKERLLTAISKIFVGIQNCCDVTKKLPNTIEDARWLQRSAQGLMSSVTSLHMKEIATEIEDAMDSISSFDGIDFQKATSLCIIFTPIIRQFSAICEHAVEVYADLHAGTCRLAHVLAKSFNQIASEGFCGPSDRSAGEEDTAGQLEQGTGLAEGQGAEDISKDVGDDEDLSELAQQQRDEAGKEGIDNEENAVDMGKDDLHGEMDEHGEVDDDTDNDQVSGSDNELDDFEQEIGSVDNLDPSAVDEKLWDSLADENEKELENEDGAGKSTKDQAAARDQNGKRADGPEEVVDEEDEQGAGDGEENVRQPQAERADPHLQQEQVLKLAEEMQLDGDQEAKEGSISDDGLDEFSDTHSEGEQERPVEENILGEKTERGEENMDGQSETSNMDEDTDAKGQAVEDEVMEDQPVPEEGSQTEEDQYQTRHDENENNIEVQDFDGAETGASGEPAEKENDHKAGSFGTAPKAELPSANQEQLGTPGDDPQGGTHEEVASGSGKHADSAQNHEAEAFKKLGDVLEKWHRQRREILAYSEVDKPQQDDIELADADFEHVENEQDQGDKQALGRATKDQARALDEGNAVENPQSQPDDGPAAPDHQKPEASPPQTGIEKTQQEMQSDALDERGPGNGGFIADSDKSKTAEQALDSAEAADEVEDVNHQFSTVDRSTTELQPLTSPEEAFRLWSHYSSLTHPLSLILTEQLRLILSPTQATKLRGDFRTGKRLNIKRIIPYIASNYKRDKIWMRRSIPSKRAYQIMLAVDDSKSMTEGGADALAFETLALLCKSLSMLEVGEICIVGFGNEEHIRIAHSFGAPFTNESGAKIYQNFSFQQSATDVKKLIRESIALFQAARAQGSNSMADLWQLQLIISDGIYEEHELIRRLVRQAAEERIMIVFVIVDSNAARGNSIMDLTQAVFEPEEAAAAAAGLGSSSGGGEMKLRMKRYLDGFPFPYYVVVREVGDLPGVLAAALKVWFREVVDVR